MSSIPIGQLPVAFKALDVPAHDELARVIEDEIKGNFENVKVTFEDCPDLTKLNIAAKGLMFIKLQHNNLKRVVYPTGLCGKPRLLEVGGVPNLVPTPKLEKLYDMKHFPELCCMDLKSEEDQCLVIGAGAAPYTFLNRNGEVNRYIADRQVVSKCPSPIFADDDKCLVWERWQGSESKDHHIQDL